MKRQFTFKSMLLAILFVAMPVQAQAAWSWPSLSINTQKITDVATQLKSKAIGFATSAWEKVKEYQTAILAVASVGSMMYFFRKKPSVSTCSEDNPSVHIDINHPVQEPGEAVTYEDTGAGMPWDKYPEAEAENIVKNEYKSVAQIDRAYCSLEKELGEKEQELRKKEKEIRKNNQKLFAATRLNTKRGYKSYQKVQKAENQARRMQREKQAVQEELTRSCIGYQTDAEIQKKSIADLQARVRHVVQEKEQLEQTLQETVQQHTQKYEKQRQKIQRLKQQVGQQLAPTLPQSLNTVPELPLCDPGHIFANVSSHRQFESKPLDLSQGLQMSFVMDVDKLRPHGQMIKGNDNTSAERYLAKIKEEYDLTKKIIFVSVHGTASSPASFGATDFKRTAAELHYRVEDLANAYKCPVEMLLFQWSGALSAAERELSGKALAQMLKQEVAEARERNIEVTIITFAHSHGCNVVLWCAQELEQYGITIDKAIQVASPVADVYPAAHASYSKTKHYFNNLKTALQQADTDCYNIKTIYHLYSTRDTTQLVGSAQSSASTARKTPSYQTLNKRVYNIHLQYKDTPLNHIDIKLHAAEHMLWVMRTVDSWYPCYGDLDASVGDTFEDNIMAIHKESPNHPEFLNNTWLCSKIPNPATALLAIRNHSDNQKALFKQRYNRDITDFGAMSRFTSFVKEAGFGGIKGL